MNRLGIQILLCACVAVGVSAYAATNPGSQFESADGYVVNYPDNWSVAPQKFRNAVELSGVSGLPGQTDNAARVIITTENRLSHADALQRLKEIDAEQNEPGYFLEIGGWPALQRQYTAIAAKPGSQTGDANEIEIRVLGSFVMGRKNWN